MRQGSVKSIVLGAVLGMLGSGCAAGGGTHRAPEALVEPPHVLALSAYEASVGTLIEVYGTGFPARRAGRVGLHFVGTYTSEAGRATGVDQVLDARVVDGGTARWTSLGPFRVPFGAAGNETGSFTGTIAMQVTTPDGEVIEDDEAREFTFRVLPSIVVQELQPLTASCAGPVQRGIGGAPYRLRVEAIGFEPAAFTYTISAPRLRVDPVSVRHLASGRFDSVGDHGDLVMPQVPEGFAAYDAIIMIEASDREGHVHQTAFAMTVRRPLEVYYNGNVQVAEVYSPTPVSGCIPGGTNGRAVNYVESETETRTRDYNVNWNESWLSMHTVTTGTSTTIGWQENNGIGFSTTDGTSFRWSLGASVETSVDASIGLSDLVKVGVGAKVGVNGSIGGETNHSDTSSTERSEGVNASETTTDTTSDSDQTGGQVGESFSWAVTSSESVSRSFGGTVIAGQYGVFYRQTVRLIRRAVLVTYNQCGIATVVGQVDFNDWAWSPDLGMSQSCPPLPQSNLPEAACYAPPCAGE